MKRRRYLIATTGTVAVAGCIGDQEEPAGDQTEKEGTEEPTEEETEEPDPAEFEITDLVVEPTEVSPSESVTVIATVKNIGGKEGTEQLQFEIDGKTVSEQTVGDSTFEEVTEEETVTEQVSVPPGESTTASISVIRELVGIFSVSLADRSVTFEVIREWNEIGETYDGASGLTVTLESFDITEKSESYEYTIEYTLENDADGGIDEGGFQLYPADPNNDPLQQFGSFSELFPGDTVSRSYTFEEENSIEFNTLAYHPDQFFRQTPPTDALVWPVEY